MNRSGETPIHHRIRRPLISVALIAALLSGLALIPIPLWTIDQVTSEGDVARNRMKQIECALVLYRLDHDRLPERLEDLCVPMPGSDELYLEGGGVPDDPWMQPFHYDPRGGTKKPYLVLSTGPDLTPGTDDDITSENLHRR